MNIVQKSVVLQQINKKIKNTTVYYFYSKLQSHFSSHENFLPRLQLWSKVFGNHNRLESAQRSVVVEPRMLHGQWNHRVGNYASIWSLEQSPVLVNALKSGSQIETTYFIM